MRQHKYTKYDKVVCIRWNGVKFTTGEVYNLTYDLYIENKDNAGSNSIETIDMYKEFRKAYKNEIKLKG